MMAAMASKSGTIGFVGGMDIPLIRKFQGGYEQGAQYVNPDIEVIANMTGTTNEAWNNPTKGAELTKAQIDGGADVVYQAAGGTGIGVLQAAADAGIMGIGVDSNQNWMHPGNMLTSMLKRLDLTIFEQAQNVNSGSFESGINILGLSEGMVGYATEDGMVTSEMAAADAAAADIASGSIVVADWSQE
jgi:basic membrane protein A